MTRYDITTFGAPADASANAAPAIQKAIDAAHGAGGGVVMVPAGRTFQSGTIELRSHVTLHLEPGSRVVASPDPAHYRDATLLLASGAENIAITGSGAIDGKAKQFMTEDAGHIYRYGPFRSRLIALAYCRNVRVTDVTLADASNWCLHLGECDDVVVRGVTILNDLKVPNCDGIDPDRCRNVRISDCHIEAGDDCIVIKSTKNKWGDDAGRPLGACENIVVSNCTMISTSCAAKIGTETWGDIRNVLFNNCTIKQSARGLGVFLRDAGNIENVLFSNSTVETRLFHDDWWGKAEPIYVTAFNRTPGAAVGTIRNVRFTNILCRGESGAFISGCPASMPEDVLLENVQITVDKWTRHAGGLYDRRPGVAGIVAHPTAGIYLQEARRVSVRHCDVRWARRAEHFGPALEAHLVEDLRVEDLRGDHGNASGPAKVIDQKRPSFEDRLKTET